MPTDPAVAGSVAPAAPVAIDPPAVVASQPKPVTSQPTATAPAAGGFGSVSLNMNPSPPPPPPPPPMGIRPPAAQAAQAAPVAAKPESKKGLIAGVAVAVVVVLGALMSMGGKSEAPKAPVAAPAAQAPSTALTAKDHLNQLLGLARDGRWKEVPAKVNLVKSMGQVNKTNAPQSKQLADQGSELLNSEQFANAADAFDKAIQADPGNIQARFGLGTSLTRQGKFDAAITVLIDGLLVAPDAGSGWLTAAEVFSELGKTEAAASALKLAYYFASNRDNARKFIEDPSRIKSEKFRKTIDTTLPALSGIPAKS